jgi:hypothetical protein
VDTAATPASNTVSYKTSDSRTEEPKMPKDSPNVSLDALIPREAFEVQGQQNQNIGRNIPMISVRDLEQN